MASRHSTVVTERGPAIVREGKVASSKAMFQLRWRRSNEGCLSLLHSVRVLDSSLAHIRAGHLLTTHNPLRIDRGAKRGGALTHTHTPKGVELQNARVTWSRCYGDEIYRKPQAAAAAAIAAKSPFSFTFFNIQVFGWEGRYEVGKHLRAV